MTRRRTLLWSLALALVLLVAGAIGISDSSHIPPEVSPTITASPYVSLHEPEPTITADSGAKIPAEPKPVVKTKHADPIIPAVPDLSSPTNIPPSLLIPVPLQQIPYVPVPNPPAVVPTPAPQRPPVAPINPPQVQPLPPVVADPVQGVTGPLKPILKPLLPPILNPIIDPLLK